MQSLEEQFPHEEGYRIACYNDFKFTSNATKPGDFNDFIPTLRSRVTVGKCIIVTIMINPSR